MDGPPLVHAGKIFSLFMNMDKMIGKDFESGSFRDEGGSGALKASADCPDPNDPVEVPQALCSLCSDPNQMKNLFRPALVYTAVLVANTTPEAAAQSSFTVGSTTVNVLELATDLDVPWDMVLGPDGWVWFTEALGRVSRMDPDNGTVELIYTIPDVHLYGFTAGLHSMAFHPDFANQPYVYLHYLISNTQSVVKRFYYDADLNTFTTESEHLLGLTLAAGPSHNGSRMIIDDQGMFLLCIGETMSASTSAQDPATSHGKVLRFDPEGGIPADNPTSGSYVYNWGHRNPQGMVKAPNGIIYNSAHGEANDDEVNIILPNRNYGWPTVRGLCNTPTEITYCEMNDVVEPIHEFTAEVVAPCGMDYFDSPTIPGWQNSLLVATLRGRELHQLQLNAMGDQVVSEQIYLTDTYGRLRDVLVHPDGRVFICTSNHDWSGTPGPTDDRILALVSDAIHTDVSSTAVPVNAMWFDARTRSIRFTAPMDGPATVSVIDASGRLVLTTRVTSGRADLPALAPGIYHANANGTDAIRTVPFAIQ
jgi:glucose/arabinose dehydrogenase